MLPLLFSSPLHHCRFSLSPPSCTTTNNKSQPNFQNKKCIHNPQNRNQNPILPQINSKHNPNHPKSIVIATQL